MPIDILTPLIALRAIVDPIGVIPVFIHCTQGFGISLGKSRHWQRRALLVGCDARWLQKSGRPTT